MAMRPQDRDVLFIHIGVTNQRKNYQRFIQPLINKGWLTMTIPDKPTSPKQQYLTTLKGRMVLKPRSVVRNSIPNLNGFETKHLLVFGGLK